MPQLNPIVEAAPSVLHAKLDRAWIIREDEGVVNITTRVRDPENAHVSYGVSISVVRDQ
jgi:hypothetical protein